MLYNTYGLGTFAIGIHTVEEETGKQRMLKHLNCLNIIIKHCKCLTIHTNVQCMKRFILIVLQNNNHFTLCFILADIIQPYSPVQAAMRGLQRPLSTNCYWVSACCPALIIAPRFAIALAPDPICEWHRLFFSQLLGPELGCKYCNVSPYREGSSIVMFTFALLVHHTTSHSKNTTWFLAFMFYLYAFSFCPATGCLLVKYSLNMHLFIMTHCWKVKFKHLVFVTSALYVYQADRKNISWTMFYGPIQIVISDSTSAKTD